MDSWRLNRDCNSQGDLHAYIYIIGSLENWVSCSEYYLQVQFYDQIQVNFVF